MTSQSPPGIQSRVKNAVSGIQPPVSRPVSVGLKFLLCGIVGQILWFWFLSLLTPESGAGTVQYAEINLATISILSALVLPSLVAAAVYLRLPTQTVDRYHWFGKSSALFFALNVSLSISIVIHELTFNRLVENTSPGLEVIQTWVIASLFLPGLCLGAFLGSRWAG